LTKPFFSFQLCPTWGSADWFEDHLEQLRVLEDPEERKKQHSKTDDRLDEEKEEKERQALYVCLTVLNRLNETLLLINSRRGQYHRG
ncbi:MAG: hypothetical protein RL235_59, partial [Chlamydiota bacterium]